MDLETAGKILTHIDKSIAAAVMRGQEKDAAHRYEAASAELHLASILLEAKAAIVGSLETGIAEELLDI